MTSDKLRILIEKEKNRLERLKTKRAELDESIKQSEAKLNEYEMMDNSQKFGAISDVVSRSGLSVEDLLAALQKGDLLSLQEQIEEKQTAKNETENDVSEEL